MNLFRSANWRRSVVSFPLLFVAGTALSFITGNFIVTAVGCFLLGLVLKWSFNKRAQASNIGSQSPLSRTSQIYGSPSSPAITSTGISCSSCGAYSDGHSNYCARCGSRIGAPPKPANETDSRRYSPQTIVSSLGKVRTRDEAKYVRVVQNLLMLDEQGKYWSIGVNSSKWYVQGDGGWVPSEPQGTMRLKYRTKRNLQSQQIVKPTQTADEKAAGKFCRFCGVEMEPSSRFCINCGHEVTAPVQSAISATARRTRTCGRCGATVNARKRFCTSCGAQLIA